MTDRKTHRHRCPLSVIGSALRLDHRFSLSQRDMQQLLHERGLVFSHEIKSGRGTSSSPRCSPRNCVTGRGRRGSGKPLDEEHVKGGRGPQWLWRAVDEHGDVLDILLQEDRDTEAARSFFMRLLATYDVPEIMHTDKL